MGASRITQVHCTPEGVLAGRARERRTDECTNGQPARQVPSITQDRPSSLQCDWNDGRTGSGSYLKRPEVEWAQAGLGGKRAFGKNEDRKTPGKRGLHPLHFKQALLRRGAVDKYYSQIAQIGS